VPGKELTPEEVAAYIEQQREFSERVAGLEEQMRRVRVTNGARISDINSSQFTNVGPVAKMQQKTLVDNATAAMKRFYSSKQKLSLKDAHHITEEFVVAICNDLMLNIETECLFGVSVPIWENVDSAYWGQQGRVTMYSKEILQETVGLLVYRCWQMMIRTPPGRKVLIDTAIEKEFYTMEEALHGAPSEVRDAREAETTAAAAEGDADEEGVTKIDYASYDLLVDMLSKSLSSANIIKLFTETLDRLPSSKNGCSIHTMEKSVVKAAILDSTLDWWVAKP
jgi:hypothetical protein